MHSSATTTPFGGPGTATASVIMEPAYLVAGAGSPSGFACSSLGMGRTTADQQRGTTFVVRRLLSPPFLPFAEPSCSHVLATRVPPTQAYAGASGGQVVLVSSALQRVLQVLAGFPHVVTSLAWSASGKVRRSCPSTTSPKFSMSNSSLHLSSLWALAPTSTCTSQNPPGWIPLRSEVATQQ